MLVQREAPLTPQAAPFDDGLVEIARLIASEDPVAGSDTGHSPGPNEDVGQAFKL